MDLTLRSGRDYLVRIVERPGLWMSPGDLEKLSAALRQIAAQTLDAGSLTYGVFSGDKARMEAVIITLVSRRDGTSVAFNALAVMDVDTAPQPTEVLHLGLVMVDPDERSKNLSWVLYGLTCFLIFVRRQFRPIWISNVTQVPAVVGMVSEMFSDVWPRPAGGRRTLNHLLLARQIMAHHRQVFGVGDDAGFDEARFVITEAYTGGSDNLKKTWAQAPKHRDESYNAYCAVTLDYDRGDDVLQLGQMDLAAMRTYLAREVPKSALLGLLVTGALVALRRLILPAIYWADSTRPFSILRPAKDQKP
ncbi:hypothetical protein SLH49_15865 [Cognatiyoonia sp. IB215446]|uniref:hypothetical protein n=1 Tax=Cognatiyoonia sp. IB215446 TaxID=3097355 RepID=UPI002A1076AF|nr:hypothetical protein [Cognatiyoonia sp. IB215446]MDX8349460.1 hypothetical protein [Cognatiyoonia sp. IB215446]